MCKFCFFSLLECKHCSRQCCMHQHNHHRVATLHAGEDAADLNLRVMEVAEVADLGMTWHRCRACLDTGAAYARHNRRAAPLRHWQVLHRK